MPDDSQDRERQTQERYQTQQTEGKATERLFDDTDFVGRRRHGSTRAAFGLSAQGRGRIGPVFLQLLSLNQAHFHSEMMQRHAVGHQKRHHDGQQNENHQRRRASFGAT